MSVGSTTVFALTGFCHDITVLFPAEPRRYVGCPSPRTIIAIPASKFKPAVLAAILCHRSVDASGFSDRFCLYCAIPGAATPLRWLSFTEDDLN